MTVKIEALVGEIPQPFEDGHVFAREDVGGQARLRVGFNEAQQSPCTSPTARDTDVADHVRDNAAPIAGCEEGSVESVTGAVTATVAGQFKQGRTVRGLPRAGYRTALPIWMAIGELRSGASREMPQLRNGARLRPNGTRRLGTTPRGIQLDEFAASSALKCLPLAVETRAELSTCDLSRLRHSIWPVPDRPRRITARRRRRRPSPRCLPHLSSP